MKINFLSRRNFLKSSTLAVTGASTFLSGSRLLASSPGQSKEAAKLLKMTGYDFPRIAALASGKAKIAGAEVQFTPGRVGDMNTDVFNGPQTYDISEIGLHPFILAYAIGDFRDYTLLPIFPLRVFRHKSIFIRTDRGIISITENYTRRVTAYSAAPVLRLRLWRIAGIGRGCVKTSPCFCI